MVEGGKREIERRETRSYLPLPKDINALGIWIKAAPERRMVWNGLDYATQSNDSISALGVLPVDMRCGGRRKKGGAPSITP